MCLFSKVTNTFGSGDFALFGLVLAISAGIGVYFAWVDRNKGSDEYMMGGGHVGPFPIGCSLAVTFFSAVTVLGAPAENYMYGTMFVYYLVTYAFCSILVGTDITCIIYQRL